ncbi:MAG: class I SAM-dependent methyltransferase [Phycisphaeraceae bacterium]|nr:class I SAM-dependent methyltransferase [Phycisphaeraceae bacterium]
MTPRRTKARRAKSMAKQADRFALYQQAVQEPEHEVAFLDRIFRRQFARPATILREDFCGAFSVCCHWVRGRPNRQAIGVDLDPKALAWGKQHNLAKLPIAAQERITLLKRDVRRVAGTKADIVAAQNFSFFTFHTRRELCSYFRAAYRNLGPQGMLALDIMGGYETFKEDLRETRRLRNFRYQWEQARFDPISHRGTFNIHFLFPDGSEIPKAFTYHWRLWTIPEIRELLAQAGFPRSDVYWEGTNQKTGKGNGVFRTRQKAPSDPAWIAYIIAIKK